MQQALGQVTPNSTTVAQQATKNLSNPILQVQAIQFQALATNTGSVFIVSKSSPVLTTDVFAEIPAPNSSPPTRPVWVVGNPTGQNPIEASDYWIVPAVSGEGVRITVVIT